jgi:sigma-B regulation protein RsbU (phosphoserine phosphatase)
MLGIGLLVALAGRAEAGPAPRPPRTLAVEYDLVCRRPLPVPPRQWASDRRIDLGPYQMRVHTRLVGTAAGWARRGMVEVELHEPGRVLPLYLAGTLLLAAVRVGSVRRRASVQQRRRLAREADEARGLQRSLLPAAPPPVPGLQIAMLFRAAHEVSGDFYLFPEVPNGRFCLVLGDVAGKGIAAALTASLGAGFLHACAENAADPAALLAAVGRSLRRARAGRTMVTACAAELEPGYPLAGDPLAGGYPAPMGGRLRWCNAGLPPPALRRGDEVTWLSGGCIPLGSLPRPEYECREQPLAPGDLLLFYTDGLIEATSPLGEMFGRERLGAALRRLPAGCAAAWALAQLELEIGQFIGDAEPYDDITAVAVRVEA